MSIGSRIKDARNECGMTQDALAAKVGITSNYLGSIERGDKLPKLATFIKLANALEVSSDSLLIDVLVVSGKIRATYVETALAKLDVQEQQTVYDVINIFAKNKK